LLFSINLNEAHGTINEYEAEDEEQNQRNSQVTDDESEFGKSVKLYSIENDMMKKFLHDFVFKNN
jgi:hypothetical protein